MKHLFVLLCIIFGLNFSWSQNELKEIKDFGTNPGNLKMFLYNNEDVSSIKKPLVIVLHGCSQNADDIAQLTGWNKIAQQHNFTVLYPQQKFGNNVSLCFNWFLNNDIEKDKGESGSIAQMIAFAIKNYNIDSNQIYITGVSAGGAMSIVLLATHPELFQSGAIMAGGAYKIATNAIQAFKVMSGNIDISAEKLTQNIKDQNLTYQGSYPKLIIYQGLEDKIADSKNAEIIINQWAGIHKIDKITDVTEVSFSNVEDITKYQYKNSSNETIITYYQIKNLGHKMLINPGEKENEGGKNGFYAVDKDFHSTYQTAKDFGLIK